MKHQLKLLGLSIDWDLEISTCDKEYYKHQQNLFIDFFNKGLVLEKKLTLTGIQLRKQFWQTSRLSKEEGGAQMQ